MFLLTLPPLTVYVVRSPSSFTCNFEYVQSRRGEYTKVAALQVTHSLLSECQIVKSLIWIEMYPALQLIN